MTAKDLKSALLQEAVRGKLVPQIASEGNARDLLEEIRKEKAKLVKEGKIKKEKPLPEITKEDIPFDIPENWCWCRLGELITFVGGYAYDSHSFIDKSDYQVLRLGNVKNGYLQLSAKPVFINAELAEKTNAFKCITNDILVTMTGTRLKRDYFFTTLVTKYDENLYINQRVGCLRPTKFIFANFLAWILKSKPILDYIFEFETGTANQGNLGSENIKTIPIPLPPLAEQKRIVAAIEKFMPLIEEYDKKETELKAFNEQIGTLTKKAILQEAVQGKLVPQIAAEGNTKDLLEEIKKEKNILIKEGKIKKEKLLPEITEDEIPFDIPESWCWCRVGSLFSTMSGLGYKKEVLSEKTAKMIRVLRGGNILDTSYVFKGDDIMISDKYVKSELFLKKNYLITPAVTSLEHIGKIGIIEKDYDDTVVGGFVLMLLPHFNSEVLSKYCLYLFGTHWFRDRCKEITHKSGQAFYNLSRDKLLNLVVPLPPLAEQKRIVAAIEKMLPLCEKIRS